MLGSDNDHGEFLIIVLILSIFLGRFSCLHMSPIDKMKGLGFNISILILSVWCVSIVWIVDIMQYLINRNVVFDILHWVHGIWLVIAIYLNRVLVFDILPGANLFHSSPSE